MYVNISHWDQFEALLKSKGVKEIYYTFDQKTRQIRLKFTDGNVIYEHVTPRDRFPFDCDIYIEPEEEITKLTKPEEVYNVILGKEIVYLVGSQKIRGFNMWVIYSNFVIVGRDLLENVLKGYTLVEGDLQY
jgi:hypothetical protein